MDLNKLRSDIYKLYTNWQERDYYEYSVDYAEGISQCLTIVDKYIRENND